MPTAIKSVVAALAELRGSTSSQIEQGVHANLLRFIGNDPWLREKIEIFAQKWLNTGGSSAGRL
jgi:hypothetical protein